MSTTAKEKAADVPEKVKTWWEIFKNGAPDEEDEDDDSVCEEEEGADTDSDSAGENAAGMTASESDPVMLAACVEKKSSVRRGDGALDVEMSVDANVQLEGELVGRKRKADATASELQTTGAEMQEKEGQDVTENLEDTDVQLEGELQERKRRAAVRHSSRLQKTGIEIHNEKGQEEKISEDTNIQLEGGLEGRIRKTTEIPTKQQITGTENQNKEDQHVRAEIENLRFQLAIEENRRLKLELDLKKKENKSLRKQNKELRAENEHYKKTTKPPRTERLCRFCKEYALHDFRNCPKRKSSSSLGRESSSSSEEE